MSFISRASGAALVALGFGSLANAQTTNTATAGVDEPLLEEIVITAEKREASIQNTAAAISAVLGEAMAEQGVTQLDDALKNVVGLQIAQGPRGLNATVRGVGPSLPTTVGGDAGISTTYDGVYSSADISSRTGFYDMARIEVLRGPQGTLYGRNAEGGVLNIVSNNPARDFQYAAGANIGNYNLKQLSGMVNVPVSDTLAVRFAANRVTRDGYLSNGQDDNDAFGARAKLLWSPNDALSLLVGTEYTAIAGKGFGTVNTATGSAWALNNFVAPDASVAYANTRSPDQMYKQHSYKVWAELNSELSFATLTVLPAYQSLSNPEQRLLTGLNNSVSSGVGNTAQRSLEVRLSSLADSSIKWLVGAYGYNLAKAADLSLTAGLSSSNTVIATSTTPNIDSNKAASRGLFAQATLPLVSDLNAIVGLRKSWDTKDAYFTNTSSAQSGEWSSFDWKAGLEYNVNKDSMMYLTVSTGYRPGGISPAPGVAVPAVHQIFQNEKLRAYELGSKNELFGKLRLNAALYYYNYDAYQLSNLVPNPPTFNPFFLLDIPNLPKVINKGAELEAQYAITSADTLSVSAAYLESTIKKPFVLGPANVQLQGMSLPNSPKLTFSATYQHEFRFTDGASLTPQLTARHVAETYVALPPLPISYQPAYWQEDASLMFKSASGIWSINAYGKNLSNEVVKSNVIANNLTLNAPRTYGVTFNANFR